jgi:hypothetical protein
LFRLLPTASPSSDFFPVPIPVDGFNRGGFEPVDEHDPFSTLVVVVPADGLIMFIEQCKPSFERLLIKQDEDDPWEIAAQFLEQDPAALVYSFIP